MSKLSVLATDLGATSGRGAIGIFDGNKITVTEINRFPTGAYRKNGHCYVDFCKLLKNLQDSLELALFSEKELASVGTDAWGLDIGMLDKHGRLLSDPFHYTDVMAQNASRKVYDIFPPEELFLETGVFPSCNKSLFSLVALKEFYPELFERCYSILHISDLVNFFFCGKRYADRTVIGTSGVYSVAQGRWSERILKKFEIPRELFSPECDAGRVIGKIRPSLIGKSRTPKVVLSCGHDTASAFLASGKMTDNSEIVISCGTRALIGTVLSEANLSEQAFKKEFTNEVGFWGSIRFLKSCTGMFLFEELRRELMSRGYDTSFEAISSMVEETPAFKRLVDPDSPAFLGIESVCDAINTMLKETGQPLAQTAGEFLRCVLESSACCWVTAINNLQSILKNKATRIHVVGGGSKNEFLMQLLADLTQMVVCAGPTEAAVMGNVISQLYALGEVKTMSEIQALIERSQSLCYYEPRNLESALLAQNQFETMFAG